MMYSKRAVLGLLHVPFPVMRPTVSSILYAPLHNECTNGYELSRYVAVMAQIKIA